MEGTAAGDAKLLNRARSGDEPAFLDLYHRYRRPVFQFAWRLTGSASAAEDVAQECFLALLDGADYDPDHGSLRTYLLGIARHRALRRIHAADREAPETDDGSWAAPEADALGSLLQHERAELVGRAIAGLPFAQREALVLFEYEDLTLEEIGQVTGCDAGAVKARLFRARESLRKRLAPLLAARPVRSSR